MSKKKKKKKRDSKSSLEEFIELHPDIHSTIESQMNIILAQGDDDDIDEWESDNTCLSDEFNDNKSSWDLSTAFYSPPDISVGTYNTEHIPPPAEFLSTRRPYPKRRDFRDRSTPLSAWLPI